MLGYILLAAAGLATTLGILWRPAETAAILVLLAPVIWGRGAAELGVEARQDAAPNIAVAVSGAATLLYARFMLQPQDTPQLKWLRIASITYCLATLPSVFVTATSVFQSFSGYVRLISPVIFMFAVLHGSRPQGAHTFQFKALALSVVSLFGITVAAQYAGKGTWYMGGFDRLAAFSLSPQHVSLYSVVGLGVLLCGVLLGRYRYLYVAGIIPLLLCTYLTGYRTAWVGMAILIAVIMVVVVRSRLAMFLAVLLLFGLISTSSVVVQSLSRYSHEDEAMSMDSLDGITSGRITTDSIAFDRYLAGNPIEWVFGIGVFSSEEVTLQDQGTPFSVHSDILSTLIECGVVGLMGYLFLLAIMGWLLFPSRRRLPQEQASRIFLCVGWALFMAFVVMGISGALYTNVFVGWYFYGFIGFVLAQLKTGDGSFQSGVPTNRLDITSALQGPYHRCDEDPVGERAYSEQYARPFDL